MFNILSNIVVKISILLVHGSSFYFDVHFSISSLSKLSSYALWDQGELIRLGTYTTLDILGIWLIRVASRQVPPGLGSNLAVLDAKKHQWKWVSWRFRIGPVMSPVLCPCGAQLGPKLLPNRSKLGPSCAILEPSWAEVGAKWVHFGPKLGPCWPKLTPSWAHVAGMWGQNGDFGRCCTNMQNVQITTENPLFGGGSILKCSS